MEQKEISFKDIMEAIKEVELPEYPKYIGGGLWKLSENCITGQKGYEKFIEELKDGQKKANEKILNDLSKIKVEDLNGMKITFSDSLNR